jgi:MFS family permease
MAFWRTPVVALMPDITPSKYRSQANGIINLMGGIGTIIASLVGSTLYEINVAFPFWMGSVLVILAALLVFIFIREPKEYEESEKQPNMFESLRELLQSEEKSAIAFCWRYSSGSWPIRGSRPS